MADTSLTRDPDTPFFPDAVNDTVNDTAKDSVSDTPAHSPTDPQGTRATTRLFATAKTGGTSKVNALIYAFFGIAAMGWFASAILNAVHFWVLPLPEGTVLKGAIAVMHSPWSYVGPIPLATIGAVYYIGMMAAAAVWLYSKSELLERLLLPVTGLGVVFSAYFVYLQLVPIGEICPFCMVSAVATVLLFALELTVKRLGGAKTAPVANPAIAGPIMIAVPLLLGLLAMFMLTVLPLPGR